MKLVAGLDIISTSYVKLSEALAKPNIPLKGGGVAGPSPCDFLPPQKHDILCHSFHPMEIKSDL